MRPEVNWIFVILLSLILAACGGSDNEPVRHSLEPASPSQTALVLELSLSSGNLTPGFDRQVTSYQAVVNSDIASLAITATMGPSDTGMTVNGQEVISGTGSQDIPLQIGDNTIEVVVIAQDGVSTETYTISVYRLNSDARLAALAISEGDLTPEFSVTTLNYQMELGSEIESVVITPVSSDANAVVSIAGQEIEFGGDSGQIPLEFGSNPIQVVVSAEDSATTVYTVDAYRQSNDAQVKALNIQGVTLNETFDASVSSYTATVDAGMTQLLLPSPDLGNGATATVNGQPWSATDLAVDLAYGANTISIDVVSEDGSDTQSYTLDVYRTSDQAGLTSLTGLSLHQDLDPSVTSYTTTVTATQTPLTLGGQGQFNGTVTINGTPDTGNGVSVDLAYGANTVTVVVTSEDGNNSQSYDIQVYRVSDQAGLTGLELVGGSLDQAFDPAVENYTAQVPYDLDQVSVIATSETDVAAIRLNGLPLMSGQASGPLPLIEGTNVVAVTVVAESVTTMRSYEVIVTRLSAPEYHADVNTIWYAIGGSPIGSFWYLGDSKWERESWYDCEGLTETARDESSIYLRNAAGTGNMIINLTDSTITADFETDDLEVLSYGTQERPESQVECPSSTNDHPPVFTSASIVEVNSGRTMVVELEARDADWPQEELSFSLTDNPESDNDLFEMTNYEENARKACRAGTNNEGHPDDPNNYRYYFVQDGINSRAECEAACNEYPLYGQLDATCKGIEYREAGADPNFPAPRCEIWKRPILDTVPQPGYSCYIRTTEKPSVISFVNPPDFKLPTDSNMDSVYQVEAQVSDGPDGHITTQEIGVRVIPAGDYLGRTGTVCRAGRQNEGHPQDPNNASFFTIVNDVDDLESCQALCDAYPLLGDLDVDCMGVEYRSEGADYADLQSRCELWHAPIVEILPQKEYACFVRDLARDDSRPDIEFYAGNYKYIDESGTHTMNLSVLSPTELRWTADDGNSWTVSQTGDRNKLVVGSDYPYLGDGYEEPQVLWDAEEIAGIFGPDNRIYRTDWVHAKYSRSQFIWRQYIDDHLYEPTRVTEAQRQIRELKWDIAERMNTAQGYRDYKADIGDFYGRTDEADRRIASFKAVVTAEVLSIEVDEDVPAIGENNDLELFYNLEFTKNWRARADESNWSAGDLILESIWQSDGQKITNIDDGADRAFRPAGSAFLSLPATENETLRYGGLMFEVDSLPEGYRSDAEAQEDIDDCNWYGPGDFPPSSFENCEQYWGGGPRNQYLFGTESVTYTDAGQQGEVDGVFDTDWNGHRTWAGGAATASESLQHSYFTIPLADLEYMEPKKLTHSIRFESDEEVRLTYEMTKRTEKQHAEYMDANVMYCNAPRLPADKLKARSSAAMNAPGFLIRNETDHVYSVSLNQVGPLYYEEVLPGRIFRRDTAWGHFTIDATLNLTGESRYSDWDVAGPIVIFTASTLQSVFSGGVPISSIKAAVQGYVSSALTSAGAKIAATAAARAAASALSKRAFGRALLRVGAKAAEQAAQNGHGVLITLVKTGAIAGSQVTRHLDEAFDEGFAQDLADNYYSPENTEEFITWAYSGDNLPWSDPVGMYHIVGGPRLACLNADGDIELRSSELRILNDEECSSDPECTLH